MKTEEAAVDNCSERMHAEAPRILFQEATGLSLEDSAAPMPLRIGTAVDICPERMDAADAEAPSSDRGWGWRRR